ncbi:unnamed protein product [Brassica oleracea]
MMKGINQVLGTKLIAIQVSNYSLLLFWSIVSRSQVSRSLVSSGAIRV